MSMIHIEGLSKSFGSNLVFQDIHVDIEQGDCISVIGPSGCGKSTFLRCINLLERPTAGSVYIDGQEITAKAPPWTRSAGRWAWCTRPSTCFPTRRCWRM